MNNINKNNRVFYTNCNKYCCNKKDKLMKLYYNLYNTGCGLDMFVKGCNVKKMINIVKGFKR